MKKQNRQHRDEAQVLAQRWIANWSGGGKPTPAIGLELRQQGWGVLQSGQSVTRRPLCVAGQTWKSGLGTHAPSEIVLRATVPLRRFKALAGWDDNPDTRNAKPANRLIFHVRAGDTELWTSPPVALGDPAVPVDVALPPGTTALTLAITSSDGVSGYTHADWVDVAAQFERGGWWRPDHGPLALQPVPAVAPFAFEYDGRPSAELLPGWEIRRAKPVRRGDRIVHLTTWRDRASGLECRLELTEFPGWPAVEWVVHFRNGGTADTPILSNIQALDAVWNSAGEPAVLHRSLGSPCTLRDFEPRRDPVPASGAIEMVAGGGRSSNEWLPFFNLQAGNAGVLLAVGWSGQWAAAFRSGEAVTVRLQAGLERTHLRLHPGEEIRSPRMLLLFWEGDRLAAHNHWRQFLLAHHVPRRGGKPIPAPLTVAHWGGMKTAHHLERIRAYAQQQLDYDYYWVDAGWYGPADSYSPDEFTGDWWKHVGNWEVNPAAHPGGLRPISDAAVQAGMKFLLWYEPERAITGTPWAEKHPDWFLGERKPLGNLLLNLGNPAARAWLTDYMLQSFEQNNVWCYRQDFNFDPLPYWRANDAPDRQGMSEIRYVEGLYTYWDTLLAKRPGLMIDDCASGGRRIDLETISRSIPLWRSDWQCAPLNDPVGGQVHGMGLSYWIPLHGTGVWSSMPASAGDVYRVRSNMGPALMFSVFPYERNKVQPDYPWGWHRKMMRDVRRAQSLFTGDYYPLTPCSPAMDQWAAYQMHRPDLKEGMVLAFRRKDSPFVAASFRLQGLDPQAAYEIEDADTGRRRRVSGKVLSQDGLPVTIDQPERSRLFFYRRVK